MIEEKRNEKRRGKGSRQRQRPKQRPRQRKFKRKERSLDPGSAQQRGKSLPHVDEDQEQKRQYTSYTARGQHWDPLKKQVARGKAME